MPTEVSSKLRNWGLRPVPPGEKVFLFGEQAEHKTVSELSNSLERIGRRVEPFDEEIDGVAVDFSLRTFDVNMARHERDFRWP